MQCPGTQLLHNEMFAEIASCADADSVMRECAPETMSILLGKLPVGGRYEAFEKLWCISGKHICEIYKYVLAQRQGIG